MRAVNNKDDKEIEDYKPLYERYRYLPLVTSSISFLVAVIVLIIKLFR